MQSHNRSLSSAMISHDLQDWLTRTSAEPAPLPRCCCEQSTCASSELFHDTIKRLEGESRLAAEIGQSLLLKYEKFVQEDEQRRREYEQKLQKTEEKIKKLRSMNDDLEKHNEDLNLKNNKLTWEHEKSQQTISLLSSDLELANHKMEKLKADNESKNAEIEKTRILRMLSRQADLRDEMNESKIDDLKQEVALLRKNELFLESKYKKLLTRYEALQNSTDSLKQANNVLAEQVENAQSAEWLRHVNDKLRTNELKTSLADSVDIRPQQYYHLISLIKELGFSNNKLKSELAEYKDMLSDSKAEVTLLSAKLEQLEISDDSDIDSTRTEKHQGNISHAVVTRSQRTDIDDPIGDRSYSTSVPHEPASTDLMRNNLRARRSATTMRLSDKQQSTNRYSTRTLTTPLYLDPANNISSSSLSPTTDTPAVVHHHYHYHVHKPKNTFQEIGHRRLRKDAIASDDVRISEDLGQNNNSLVPGKSPHTTDISKPVVTSIPTARRKSLLSSSLTDLSKKQQSAAQASDVHKKSKGSSNSVLHSQWSFDHSKNDCRVDTRTSPIDAAADYQRHASDTMDIQDTGLSLCKDAPYHSLQHLGVHFFERLKATDIRALNRQLRRAFDILELSSMSNSIIDNVLTDVRVLKTRFLWVEQSIATFKPSDGDSQQPWETDVSMDDFFPLVELTEMLLSEIGEMRITLNDLQVEYVNKVEQIEHQAEKDILHKRELKMDKPGNDSTFSWFTNILARYQPAKDFERTPTHKRHKRTVSHESITSQLMERMEEESHVETKDTTDRNAAEDRNDNTMATPIMTKDAKHDKASAATTRQAAPQFSSSLFGLGTDLESMEDHKPIRKPSATLIPRASRSTGTLRKSKSTTRPKESAKSSTLRQYLSTTLSGSLSDYYQDDSRPTSPDVDWKIANGIGTRRFYK